MTEYMCVSVCVCESLHVLVTLLANHELAFWFCCSFVPLFEYCQYLLAMFLAYIFVGGSFDFAKAKKKKKNRNENIRKGVGKGNT